MKSLILVLVVVVGLSNIVGAIDKALILKHHDACVLELKLDPATHPLPTMPPPGTRMDLSNISHDRKCIWMCVMKKENMMSEAGQLNLDVIKKRLPDNIAAAVDFDKCLTLKDDDPCQSTFLFNKCVLDQVVVERKKQAGN